MPGSCKTCLHPSREAIDRALIARVPFLQIARTYNLSRDSIANHARTHLVASLVRAGEEAQAERASDLLAELRELHARTLRAMEQAEKGEDARTVLVGVREARHNLVLLTRVAGAVEEKPGYNLLTSPEWPLLQDALLEALAPFPEARIAAAERLGRLTEPGPA